MPLSGASLADSQHLSLLVLGPSKIGKTTSVVTTSPKPYIVCSDGEKSLEPILEFTRDFKFDLVDSTDGPKLLGQAEKAWAEARRGAIAGEYETIIWDTISFFSAYLMADLLERHDDGKWGEAYSDHNKKLLNYTARLLQIPAHVIVIAHDFPVTGKMEGQLAKKGDGILPAVEGSIRTRIPGMFQNVVYMAKEDEERFFLTSVNGVFGPGCRNLPAHVSKIPADVGAMWQRIQKQREGRAKGPPPPSAKKVVRGAK